MADSTTIIIGNLTEDPELRYTPGGAPVVNFGVAVTPRVKDGDDWKDGDTSFFRCTAWRSLAEHLADSLGKGDRILAHGRLVQRRWETDAGDKRSTIEVQVDDLGPSLKWATTKVERTRERATSSSSARQGGQFDDEPTF